jgi:hypothetical protein
MNCLSEAIEFTGNVLKLNRLKRCGKVQSKNFQLPVLYFPLQKSYLCKKYQLWA